MDVIRYKDPKTTLEALGFEKTLGEEEVVILFDKHDAKNEEVTSSLQVEGLTVRKGLLVKDAREAQRHRKNYDVLIGPATRELLESKAVDVIYQAELVERKDKTHRRGAGLNQVAAKLVKDTGKTYALDLTLLLDTPEKAKLLGRMRQNKHVLEKYGCAVAAYSFAQAWHEARPPAERAYLTRNL